MSEPDPGRGLVVADWELLRLALAESSEGQVGTVMDRVLLMCFSYNPVEGKYSLAILGVVRLGGVLTVALLVGFWLVMWRRSRGVPRLSPPGGETNTADTAVAPGPSRQDAVPVQVTVKYQTP